MRKKIVAVAVSGGMDSLMALVFLAEAGWNVLAIHALLAPEAPEKTARRSAELDTICRRLGVSLHIIDLREDFADAVIDPFVNSYLAGLTPNPCAACNVLIKFGKLRQAAKNLGADFFASGHYAGQEESFANWEGPVLTRAEDLSKDQSYFLSLVPPAILQDTIFPLSEIHKKAARRLLAERDLYPPVREESREICFIPDDYRNFIAERLADSPTPGPIILQTESETTRVGTHSGLWNYTLGQRRGLGIPWQKPLYVLHKDIQNNALILGPKECLNRHSPAWLEAQDPVIRIPQSFWPAKVLAQTSFRRPPDKAVVEISGDKMRVKFTEAAPLFAAGQVVTIYTPEGVVLAAGWIN